MRRKNDNKEDIRSIWRRKLWMNSHYLKVITYKIFKRFLMCRSRSWIDRKRLTTSRKNFLFFIYKKSCVLCGLNNKHIMKIRLCLYKKHVDFCLKGTDFRYSKPNFYWKRCTFCVSYSSFRNIAFSSEWFHLKLIKNKIATKA